MFQRESIIIITLLLLTSHSLNSFAILQYATNLQLTTMFSLAIIPLARIWHTEYGTLKSHAFCNHLGLAILARSSIANITTHIYQYPCMLLCRGEIVLLLYITIHTLLRADIARVKEAYAEGDYLGASKKCPFNMDGERAVLEWLSKNNKDFCGAYSRINKFTRLICAHAYQSFIWNMAASVLQELSACASCALSFCV